ncbi:hypothetical protein, conserved [Eimeria necatrix]|uniref:Uncharacterized protein n=1 Tax=Eimeria necatrix TaxID=51315 RepID=U6MKA5_9EIME|nr:hypothetical protein, conserved [Eimeria necatrix]CDJ63513.1 hypothetical protein, conserved [Eimeria necatrix]
MDVQSKINCSLDDLIRQQRRGPKTAAVGTPQKGAAPQRFSRTTGVLKKPVSQKQQQARIGQRPQQQQLKYSPRPQQPQVGASRRRQQQQQQQQARKSRNLSVADKINLPLDALIASRQEQQQRQQPKQQQQQQQQRVGTGVALLGRKTGVSGRRGTILASRISARRGRLGAAAAATAAIRGPPRGAAAKALATTARKEGRFRTPHQQVVETLKSAAGFKNAATRRSAGSNAYIRAAARASTRARFAAAGSRRLDNGALQLRRRPAAALYPVSRLNTSLARRRAFGATLARATSNTAAAQEPHITTGTAAKPVDRRRPPPTLLSAPAAGAVSPPSHVADPEALANIKIMATLDTVPAPLPQQRGTHVAIPAAMQRQQEEQQQQPSRAVGAAVADHGSLSSRFGY